jgi:hypothetical protein
MTPAVLSDLLNRMTFKEVVTNSGQSVAWRAYREAEGLEDESVINEIESRVRDR